MVLARLVRLTSIMRVSSPLQSERIPYGTLLWASGINTRPVVKNLIEKIGKV